MENDYTSFLISFCEFSVLFYFLEFFLLSLSRLFRMARKLEHRNRESRSVKRAGPELGQFPRNFVRLHRAEALEYSLPEESRRKRIINYYYYFYFFLLFARPVYC